MYLSRPNTFIIGAPKCGTTSMAAWLSGHPDVTFASVKEPNFFCDDLDLDQVSTLDDYLQLFDESARQKPIVAEASTWYLYSNSAVPRIESMINKPKYIVMIRHPIDMALSLFRDKVRQGVERAPSFEVAWGLSEVRRSGSHAMVGHTDPRTLCYQDVCQTGSQIRRLLKSVPLERVHTIVLDDLALDPENELRRTLSFLGLNAPHALELETLNRGRAVLSRRVAYQQHNLARRATRVRNNLGLPDVSLGILKLVEVINTLRLVRPVPLGPGIADELQRWAEPEIAALEEALRRSLVSWREVDTNRTFRVKGR